jgi:hypothetical protein
MNFDHLAVLAHSLVVKTGHIVDDVLGELTSHNATSTSSDRCETACDSNKERKRDSAVEDLKERVTQLSPLSNNGPQDDKMLEISALLASLQEDLGHLHEKVIHDVP